MLSRIQESPKVYEFSAQIQTNHSASEAWVAIPFDVKKTFGKNRVWVQASFDGESYQGPIVRKAVSEYVLLLGRRLRKKISKQADDYVAVTLYEDPANMLPELTPEIKQAFEKSPEEAAFFHQLSCHHQNEYVEWVVAAKKAQTRIRRLNKMLVMLKEKVKKPF